MKKKTPMTDFFADLNDRVNGQGIDAAIEALEAMRVQCYNQNLEDIARMKIQKHENDLAIVAMSVQNSENDLTFSAYSELLQKCKEAGHNEIPLNLIAEAEKLAKPKIISIFPEKS